MRNIFYLLGILVLAHSCNNHRIKNVGEIAVVEEKLDSNLVRGVLNLIRTGEHIKYPEIELNESYIAMGFLEISEHLPPDSTILIFYCHDTFMNENNKNNYKGMLNIDGYNVAVFDKGNFGDKYYNIDSLQQISLENFKHYPMKTLFSEQYYVIEGELKYYGSVIIPDSNW